MSNSDSTNIESIDNNCESSLHEILRNCVIYQSNDSFMDDLNQIATITIDHHQEHLYDYYKMISNSCNNQKTIHCDDNFGDNILEEDGRISLAYENLKTIPKRIADKFADHTKFLDLSYNNFQNLSFLSFFEDLHTLILDRNTHLDVNSLPFLPNLRILWINNCEIMNISDWLHRIQKQCPKLTQLSLMGNHGTKTLFNYYALTSKMSSPPSVTTSTAADYREYVFNILPNLLYLDGIQKCPSTRTTETINNNNHSKISLTTNQMPPRSAASANGNIINNNINNNNNSSTLSTDNSLSHGNSANSKNTLPANIREFFRLKKRKKNYQSSSTN